MTAEQRQRTYLEILRIACDIKNDLDITRHIPHTPQRIDRLIDSVRDLAAIVVTVITTELGQ